MREALDLKVTGIVQGVGFRPFVYREAQLLGVTGWVLNAIEGVHVHAEAERNVLDEFALRLAEQAPAAAQVKSVELTESELQGFDTFEIRLSQDAAAEKTTLVSADLATCADCARELFDPANRRYRYPFINCTNCGPRFTIIDELPYDRPRTSMKQFEMCPDCAAEYADPADRRFHAQPDACFECGPVVSWLEADAQTGSFEQGGARVGATRQESDAVFARAVELLQQGKILAVKGLGGFHLVCDAENEQAVALLRARKRREGKPFAVMAFSVEAAREFCYISADEQAVLTGIQHPIVLLKKQPGAEFVPGLADELGELGVMLPYTPVQLLLMHDFAERGGRLLVMTSGNLHDEPIVIDSLQAPQKFAGIADAILDNNRQILTRYDDSVVRVLDFGTAGTALQFVRRARGYAPVPFTLADSLDIDPQTNLLATGPEQKVTATFMRGSEVFVTQHIGDMENAETNDAWHEAVARYRELFDLDPAAVACDRHPEYLTSKWAHGQALPVTEVQHHHAHIVSALAENGLVGPALGLAFDGTGYGGDGAIWGGEALLCNLQAFERFGNFVYVPMPGGAAAVKEPLRMAYGVLWAYDLLEHPAAQAALVPLGQKMQLFEQMIDAGINTPYTSSVGRLFDAASALLGICVQPKYEGEGAILLEAALASPERGGAEQSEAEGSLASPDPRYTIAITKNVATESSTAQDTSVLLFDAAPTFQALLDDKAAGVPVSVIALRFHQAFVELIVMVARLFQAFYGLDTIALSGGVFLNRYLTEHAVAQLIQAGFTVALNREVPPSDGCISLGQAVVACAQKRETSE